MAFTQTAHSLSPVSPKSLMSIEPKNWHRYPVPPPAGSYIPAYVPEITFTGGVSGHDVDEATANATDDYEPRTQADKAATLGTTLAVDVGIDYGDFAGGASRTGTVEPHQPYPTAAPEEPLP